MDRIFAPWRREYVSAGTRPEGCVLCLATGGGDVEKLVVHRGSADFVVMNLFPYSSGHVMVAPFRHVASLTDATPDELNEMMALARQMEDALAQEYRPDGINIGMNLGRSAGAGVADHIHLHVLPRWNGDANFMTVVGQTRVLPEEPAQGCARLRPYFSR
jgi:ATP adenylyltransferase